MRIISAFLGVILVASSLHADSRTWSYLPNFAYDPWNTPIFPYVATIPDGTNVAPENLRAMVKKRDLDQLRAGSLQTPGKRLVKRQVVSLLNTDSDVQHARTLLVQDSSATVDVFQVATGYVDKFGMLSILQLVASWQCGADEQCPAKISQKLDSLLAKGGRIMKTETFTVAGGQSWILATITYEVPVGSEFRVVPVKSRMLQVQEEP